MRSLKLHEIEEGETLQIDFQKLKKSLLACKEELVPAVAQEEATGIVLIIGFVNEQALKHTLETGLCTFWSSSRNELWEKGAASGDYLDVTEIRVNCEQNSLLYRVRIRKEGSCHTKNRAGKSRSSCFYRRIKNGKLEFLTGESSNPTL